MVKLMCAALAFLQCIALLGMSALIPAASGTTATGATETITDKNTDTDSDSDLVYVMTDQGNTTIILENENGDSNTTLLMDNGGNSTAVFLGDEALNNVVVMAEDTIVDDEAFSSQLACTSGLRKFDPMLHKKVYRVGVHANRGAEAALQEYNRTFATYLSVTAGRRFVPPIEFEMVAVDYQGLFDKIDRREVDFFFANPSVMACVGAETGAQPLATVISRLEVRGHQYSLDVYGGVIATLADRHDINVIEDLEDKIIGSGTISNLMAGQLQFYEMQKAGMSFVMSPKQVVFASTASDVPKGLLNGEFDVGFFGADQIERMVDDNGRPIDPNLFKIISPKVYVMDDGLLFPFLHSTEIYPQWAVAALDHVNVEISEEVQQALLAIGKHAKLGLALDECQHAHGEDQDICDDDEVMKFPEYFDPEGEHRCDTTRELAKLSQECSSVGNFTGFRPSRSYSEARTMLQEAGFMQQDSQGAWKCSRAEDVYDGIVCPEGFFRQSREKVTLGCQEMGLECKEGYTCYCRPCVKAFEVDVYPYEGGSVGYSIETYTDSGCKKMSLCATTKQGQMITFRVFDNLQRAGARVTVIMHAGELSEEIEMENINGTYAYQFTWSHKYTGIAIMEVYVNNIQIPQSPVRVQINETDCSKEADSVGKVPNEVGVCICGEGYMEIGNHCASKPIFFAVFSIMMLVMVFLVGLCYWSCKRNESDQLWHINVDELHFDDPIRVIGQGAFGQVLMAEYRGTHVAIKRVLPRGQKKKSTAASRDSIMTGSRDSMGKFSVDSMSFDAAKASNGCGSLCTADGAAKILKDGKKDIESQSTPESIGTRSKSIDCSDDGSGFEFFAERRRRSKCASVLPWLQQDDEQSRFLNVLLSSTAEGTTTAKPRFSMVCPWLDPNNRRKNDFIVEMRLLSRLRHPSITTVMGAVITPGHEPMLVMEYMEYGSLYDLLRNETLYANGEIILQIVKDIAQGLRYLHESKPAIYHGDLKSRNILIDSRFRAKVCDFGLSTKQRNGLAGTPYFLAPEYLRGRSEYGAPCDIYSFGIILFEIYARKNPYAGENPREVLRKVCDTRINKRPRIPECCPPKIVELMKRCWSQHPNIRPTAKELDMTFMDMDISETEPLTKKDKTKTIGISSADMLYQIFPKHIADALKSGEKVEPEQHELVTIVFTDIARFTDISSSISAIKVSGMLDRLYLAFDRLSEKHKIFKVETIGDAYMGVTNLLGTEGDSHVKQIAQWAMEAVQEAGKILIDEDNPKRGFVRIRVGFHSGPVVSNVIGQMNPRYSIFGDTVNIASQMENTSLSCRIQCTDVSAKLLAVQAPDIPLKKRGTVGVKGKGQTTTYWVGASSKAASSSLPAATLANPSEDHHV